MHCPLGGEICIILSVVGSITAHVALNRHLKLVGVKDSSIFPLCSEEEETAVHSWVSAQPLLLYGNAS